MDPPDIFKDALNSMYSSLPSQMSIIQRKFNKNFANTNNSNDQFQKRIRQFPNFQRIKLVSNVLPFDSIPLDSAAVSRYCKSDSISNEFRNWANIQYQHKHFKEAMNGYNLSLAFASSSHNLSLAIANRSALHFEAKNYSNSLMDISRALELDYPEHLRPKIRQREAKCCSKLGIQVDTWKYSDLASLQTKQIKYGNENFEKHMKCKDYSYNYLFKLKDSNPRIPSAEGYITIKSNIDRGRHVVTTRDIIPGTTIIVEKPFAMVLLNELKWDFEHCHNCHKVVETGTPCEHCIFGFFCSDKCRINAMNSFHKYECICGAHLHQLKPTRTLLLALRVVTTLGPENVATLMKDVLSYSEDLKCQDDEVLGNTNGVYASNLYKPIYHLISHPDKCSSSELLSYSLTAMTLTQILDQSSTFFHNFGDQKLQLKDFVASLILLHLLNLPCNAHSLQELKLNCDAFVENHEDLQNQILTSTCTEYGAGAFSLLSLINHSCEPNVTRVNLADGTTAIITLRHLRSGEEILDNYGHHYAIEELNIRRNELLEKYYFMCQCLPCSNPEKWKLFQELKLIEASTKPVRICPECYQKDGNEVEYIPEGQICICPSCKNRISEQNLETQLEKHVDSFFVAHDLVLRNEPIEALPYLINSLSYFQLNFQRPFLKLNEVEETLKQAYFLIAKCTNELS